MNSVITVLYFNGRVYEDNDGVIFEGSKKVSEVRRGVLWAWEKIKMERDDGGQVWQWGARTGLLNEDN